MWKRISRDVLIQFRIKPIGTIINMIGMSIGIGFFFLILIYLDTEFGIHKSNPRYGEIFRISKEANKNGYKGTPGKLGEILADNLPEVESYLRFDYPRNPYTVKIGQNVKTIPKVGFADSTLFEFFPARFLFGDPETCLDDPYSLVLTESAARRVFGTVDLIGEPAMINNEHQFVITGIIEDPSAQTHLDSDGWMSFSTYAQYMKRPDVLDCFNCFNFSTYVILKKGIDPVGFTKKMNEFIVDYGNMMNYEDLFEPPLILENLHDVYFEKEAAPAFRKGNLQQMRIMAAIGIMLLLIVLINYINLSTAQSTTRLKELAIRKITGASRRILITTILTESVILAVISTGLAFLLMLLIKPFFINLFEIPSDSNLSGFLYWIFIPLGAIFWGILSGFYPSLIITRFGITSSLLSMMRSSRKGSIFRNILTGVQLGLSIVLIICTSVIFLQMRYISNAEMGFDSDKLMYVRANIDIRSHQEAFRGALLTNPGIENASFSYGSYRINTERWGDEYLGEPIDLHMEFVDHHYIETLGLELVEGRNFYPNDSMSYIIINEAAKDQYFGENAVGIIFDLNGVPTEIVGVVKDFQFSSFHNLIEPIALMYSSKRGNLCNIRLGSKVNSDLISFLEKQWNQFSPDFPFEYYFVEDVFRSRYQKEYKLGKMFMILSIITIFVACLGIYGLVIFILTKRSKEVAIRKVNGASFLRIIMMLTAKMSLNVIIAAIPAISLAVWLMNGWLENFAYRTMLPIWIFPMSILMVWIMTLLTSFGKTISTARINPVEVLRGD